MINNIINSHILSKYVILSKSKNNDKLEVFYPKNLILGYDELFREYTYKDNKLYMLDTNSENVVYDNIPKYILRIITYQDIIATALLRNVNVKLALFMTDASNASYLHIQHIFTNILEQNDLEKEKIIIDNIEDILSARFNHLDASVHDGCNILFSHFFNEEEEHD